MAVNDQQRSKKARREWIQIDALSCGTGWDEKDLTKPQILIEDVYGASHPGSYHLNGLAEEASIGVFQEGGKPADILTRAAFENAIRVHAAISGSTNALIHLPAIAHELGIDIDESLFDGLNQETPYLGNIQPSGKYLSELFWYAGGIPRVQIELRDMLDLNVLTVTGKTLGENIAEKDFNQILDFGFWI